MEEKLLNEVEERDAIDMLLDDECTDDITLYDENNNPVDFEQIAVIPLEDRLFAILKPVDPLEGVNEDEGIVIEIDEEEDNIHTVDDDKIVDQVFEEYYKLNEE